MRKWALWLTMISLNTVALKANEWVKNFGDKAGDVEVEGVVTDSDNNAIITGTFSSAQLKLNETTTLQNNGTIDVFLIKYNPQGEIVWTRSFGGIKEEYVNDISIDGENNIYITGNFRSNSFTVGNTPVISSWPDNVYVAKFNFGGSAQQNKVGEISGGQRNRVHLAMILKEGGNVLLLDEPTNDLDVNTLRALEEALDNYGGCAVIISHDRWFLDRIATHIMAFEGDSQVVWFEGNYSDYEQDYKKRMGAAADQPHRIKYRHLTRE